MLALVALVLISAPLARASSSFDAQSHLGEGLRLYDLQRYEEAAREFRLALVADPDLHEARYHLAVVCFEQHQYSEAQQQFERLRKSGYKKDWITYYFGRLDLVHGEWEGAVRQFESLARAQPLEDELYYLGFALMQEGHPAHAILVLKRQIAFNPRDFRAHNLIARAYLKVRQPQEAEREFEKAEELHRYYLEGKQELGTCRNELATGHTEQAWAQCGTVLQSDDIDKLVSVGMLFGSFQDYPHALAAFTRAQALDPDSPEVNYNLGYTYFQQKEYPHARKFLEAALRERPDFFEALEVDGSLLSNLGEGSMARRVLERAHALRPKDPAVSQMLAKLDSRNQP